MINRCALFVDEVNKMMPTLSGQPLRSSAFILCPNIGK